MEDCVPSLPTQTYIIRGDGTFFNPSSQLCWDSQYYGNSSGSLLGLYTCLPQQNWDLFHFDGATGHISYNATPGLCDNGGSAPAPLPSPQQLAWMRVSLMISYDIVTSLTEVSNPRRDSCAFSSRPLPRKRWKKSFTLRSTSVLMKGNPKRVQGVR